jgi:hypothetical protein
LGLDKKLYKTNDMHLTFIIHRGEDDKGTIAEVFPESYRDAMLMCDSRRRVLNLLF